MEVELPEDVLEEVLLRLPIESLVKFRKLSKQWFRLITSSRLLIYIAHRGALNNCLQACTPTNTQGPSSCGGNYGPRHMA
ncbi:unnamed protein product [Rhodiola kirilowii]